MALLFHNGTTAEATIGSSAMHASSNVSVTTSGVTSAGATAPNLVNAATGIPIYINSLPSTGNYTVELMESGVSKASATINLADMQLGTNYVRFGSAYTFATLTASAYTAKVTNTTANSGTLVQATSGLWFLISYDSTSTPGTSDDVIGAGWHNAGLTPKTWTPTGTANSFGAGTVKNLGSSVTRTMQAGLMIGNGFTYKHDTTADCTTEIRGAIFVTKGGHFDISANTSDIEIVSKLIINSDVANADYGIHIPPNFNGKVTTTGMTVEHRTKYLSGTGTAADPIITDGAHNLKINDELIVPGLTYNGNQNRFAISFPAANQIVVSTTAGGAEAAITNTPAAGVWIGNLTRNCVVASKTNTRGYYLYNNAASGESCNFDYTRWEYASCVSGPNLQFVVSTTAVISHSMNGMVGYHNSTAGRTSWTVAGTVTQDINDCILYETLGSNYSGQSGLGLQSASNKTINRLMHYAAPGSTSNCAGLSLTSSSTNNIINDSHFYGATANNGSLGYAIGLTTTSGNTFNNCTVNNSRVRAIYATDGSNNTFNNCNFGTVGTNVQDIFAASNSLITMLFNNCNFGSATLVANYLNTLDGSEFLFHNYQATAHKHRWYTNRGWAQATGTGLEDTTVRTASSYNIKINPENATGGFIWEFSIKSIVDQIAFFKAYLRKNSTMGTDDAKVELFLPGTDLAGTADAIFNASDVADTYQNFMISELYSGDEDTEAIIRVTVTSATAGAAVYMADFYDSTGALNSWAKAKPTRVVVPTDFTAVPGLVWAYPDTNTTAGTMGKRQVDAADDADTAANK